mgnify:CR=1 FL=1
MNTLYMDMDKETLIKEKNAVEEQYIKFKNKNLSLDMSRGKPSKTQLNLSLPMMDVLNSSSDYTSSVDVRNYGLP